MADPLASNSACGDARDDVDIALAVAGADSGLRTYTAACGRWESYAAKSSVLTTVNQNEALLRQAFAAGHGPQLLGDANLSPSPGLLDVFAPAFASDPAQLFQFAQPFEDEASVSRVFAMSSPGDPKPAPGKKHLVRQAGGSSACVRDLSEFRRNFDTFTEGALSKINWDGVVVAGGCVLASLTAGHGVHRKANSVRRLRKHFHRGLYSQADVDLFLVGYGKGPEEEVCLPCM